ncbi:MAG TPA: DinB family protein [Terriglobia bacterium]|nr:DinB family protein [Terriglobia bacterium]
MPTSRKPEDSLLLDILDQGFERKAWHGPNLRQSLRGVSAKMAAWRPAPERHNIWEIAIHAAYWKYRVRRGMRGDNRGSFALEGSNWFKRPMELSQKAWRADLALLETEHRKLRQAIVEFLEGKTQKVPARLLFGIAFHDVYHAGQIGLLRRLYGGKIIALKAK